MKLSYMYSEPSRGGRDHVQQFLVGVAITTTLVAALVVGFELRGAAAGDPVDLGSIGPAVLGALTTISYSVIWRRD